MKITLPKTYGKPLYKVEFRPNGYHIDGKRVKRTTTVLERYPDTKAGLIEWSKERVAITAARLLKDRVKEHPQTHTKFCYFPADQIDAIINASYLNPDDIKDETAEVGNAVHAFCSEWLLAGATEERRQAINANYYLPPNPDLLQLLQEKTDTRLMPDTERNLFYDKMKSYMFNRFCKEWTASGLTCVGSEIVVGSRKYGVGGRIDILAKDKKKRLVLPDIKTTKYVAPKMFAQLAAYKLQYEEMYGEKIHRAFIIHLPREWSIKNMGFGVYERPLAKYKGTFLHLLRNWKETEFSSAEKCRKDRIS
jgi:hypothetical protein